MFDETVWHLGQALLPALERPHEVSSMYAAHMLLAINSYFASAFGGMRVRPHPERGILASWQLRRATEMMMSNLSGDIALSEVAAGCGLSLSYFTRAFKQSTGDPPHRWLLASTRRTRERAAARFPDDIGGRRDRLWLCRSKPLYPRVQRAGRGVSGCLAAQRHELTTGPDTGIPTPRPKQQF